MNFTERGFGTATARRGDGNNPGIDLGRADHPLILSLPSRRRIVAVPFTSAFTLVEVLAAMLLIGIVLPIAMQGVATATRAGSAARHRTEASTLAQGKLSELTVTGAWQTSARSGDFGTGWPGYTWAAAVSDWAGNANVEDGPDLQQLDVTVTFPDGGRSGTLTVSGLVYVRPLPSS